MKKILGFLILVIIFSQNSIAANSLKFSETIKDLGTIEQFKKFEWIITVKNISNKPVTFTNIKTTCGCTMARPEKKTLLPGETTKFIVHFNSEYFHGHIEKLVFIDTSTKESYTLRIIANVQKGIYLEPERIKISTRDDYVEQLVEVKSFSNPEKIKIKKIYLPKIKGISYELTGNRAFVLKINPQKIDKYGLKIIKIELNGNYEPLRFFLNIKKIKEYTVTPNDNLLFLNVKKGKMYEKTVYITANEKFNIITKKSNIPFAKLKEVKKISDKKWKVTVIFNPNKIFRATSGKSILSLKTDNPKISNINLYVVFHLIK
ncbi:hypothetical protein TTHT_0695 [Thermotomaculum hydrothermale]|uniref:DUF1573 domain-containing protein n=1 Tax=Thermotomaculum hydrothermale TaxID=981385 RepID=A0A7R6SZ06_9BACT|nr:DUF1573 domain-containing protein [Thermotomaculum hydrothermale]BBB32267.1 hypothetical protein TTHT_0695 [Thermotomaculum hydrothermale]